MGYVLRALRLVAMVVWVGGLIFFAFVEAPTAFHVMGTTREFALLIGGSVAGINHFGLIAGMVFVIASLLLWKHSSPLARKLLGAELPLVILMIAATEYVQMHVVPAMERDRAAVGGDITSVPEGNPTRADFDALHARSEKVEGSGLFLGLGVVLLMAGEETRQAVAAPTR
jgi:putative copper export protein